jgi:hypothetical protein
VSTSDYKKNRININDLIPNHISKTEISKSIQENLFNRFFTKDEYIRTIGIIGDVDPRSNINNKIPEIDEYRSQHQLQPIPHVKIGSIDHYLSFNDLLKRLEYLGVNIDRYNEWGNSLQFNWVPPIDIDKIINYQDYFWISDNFDDIPQYITIKNICTWSRARANKIKDTILSIQNRIFLKSTVDNIISLSGNVQSQYSINEYIILSTSTRDNALFKITDINFNNLTLNTELTLNLAPEKEYEFLGKTKFSIKSIIDNQNKIILYNDVTTLFTPEHVFSLIGSVETPTTYHSVKSSEYIEDENHTEIILNENLLALNWTYASVLSQILSSEEELKKNCIENYTSPLFSEWNDNYIGELLWSPNKLITKAFSRGNTILGDDNFYDDAALFLTNDVRNGDILNIIDGKGKGSYPILSITNTVLGLSPTVFFFTDEFMDYQITRILNTALITSIITPSNPELYDLWIDKGTNQLKQWNNSSWEIVVNNINLIVNSTFGRHLIKLDENNIWSDENNWVHKTQLKTFDSALRAQLPIIEYAPFLKFSSTSFATKEWKYRDIIDNNYKEVDIEPRRIEIQDIRLINGNEFSFMTSNKLILHEKFGNLINDLKIGERIVFHDFNINTGNRIISNIEYYKVFPDSRYQTVITFSSPVINPFDLPIGAYIGPEKTSMGDPWLGIDAIQWRFEGIVNIEPSSIIPTPNPMLEELIETKIVPKDIFPDPDNPDLLIGNPIEYETNIGLVWQSFSYPTPVSVTSAIFELDDRLHDLALYEDYQEGDIRVYINNIRQYGNFVDLPSRINPEYVGSIQFDEDTTITNLDTIRIELGEYSSEEIGKRAININTEYGNDLYNLVDIRLMEQIKFERNQYPYFSIFDVSGDPKTFANNIFKYNESSSYSVNQFLKLRIVADSNTKTFEFINELFNNNTEELYCYYDAEFVGNELQNIWKRGLNNEQYVPIKIENTEFWELPNQLYYNVQHKNREIVSFKDIYRHFRTISDAQTTSGIYSNISNLFHLDDNINWGLGGTIKEHNDNFDLLISSIFLNNINPITLIQFAHDQYKNNFKWIEEKFIDDFIELIDSPIISNVTELINFISEYLIDKFETNDRYDQWFGDSTTYDEEFDTGIKNWIATGPYIGLSKLFKPYINQDKTLNILELMHHDGHRKQINLSIALKEKLNKKLEKLNKTESQLIQNDSDLFPTTINGNSPLLGDFVIRTNKNEKYRKVYRFNIDNVWEEISYEWILINCFLDIENRLYENAPEYEELRYDFSIIKNDVEYNDTLEKQFIKYGSKNSISYLFTNEIFYKGTDPYTWNYSFSPISVDPKTGLSIDPVKGSWQALYEEIYGTPYPHLEPWKLQGYENIPDWWNDVYKSTLTNRRWKSSMWNNILNGRVPIGKLLSDGTISTGINGESQTYLYVSVNIESMPTIDGILPDGLLPPYWNSSNSSSPNVRSLYDPNLNEFIESPDLDFDWGKLGREEWKWNVSSQRIYDEMITAFLLQPLKFLSQSYGIDFSNINCLKINKETKSPFAVRNTLFHGDVMQDANDTYKIHGFGQWYVHYNRYYNFDGVSSEFRTIWADWNSPLSYEFSAFIDTPSFNIFNNNFDITTKDYSLDVKKTPGIDQKSIFGLKSRILSIPSKYSRDRDYGMGWTAEFFNLSPDNSDIIFYGNENYDYRLKNDNETFRIYSYNIADADIREERGLQVINYNQNILLSDSTQYPSTFSPFYATILIDGTELINLSIIGANTTTVEILLNEINNQLGVLATATLENGNIYIRSDTIGSASSVSITDAGLFATSHSSYTSIQPPMVEPLQFNKKFIIDGNYTTIFKEKIKIIISESTNYNGEYTIFSSYYDISRNQTNIIITENISIINNIIDGIIEPLSSITLPDNWITGTEIFLNGNTSPPTPLDVTIPYYLIRIDDRDFKLAETSILAENNKNIKNIITNNNNVNLKIGRLQRTFKALDISKTSTVWRRHYSDKRIINKCPNLINVSSVQNMVDFLTGYEDYLEDLGFSYKNIDGDNYDVVTGRTNDWQFEIEKYISNIYNLRSRRQEEPLEYKVEVDSVNNNFKLINSLSGWQTGTQVIIIEGDETSVIPKPFNSIFSNIIPYYIIRGTTNDIFQLAYTENDAINGRYINIIDDGIGDIRVKIFKRLSNAPELEINPIKNSVWVNNDIGVLADVFDGSNLDVTTTQAIFDNDKKEMNRGDVIVFRLDKENKITLINELIKVNNNNSIDINRYMSGMNLFYDGYEHILRFSDYTTNNSLIYDSFLGVNTLNFFLEFNKQSEITFRPNVGGFVIHDNKLIQNIESSVTDIRYLYDTYTNIESKPLISEGRKSLGFSKLEYMNDLSINDKSQFLFWKGMIQNKGTNFAINAFINQNIFQASTVDEFWAYKLADFGDEKQKIYPEIILFPEDVIRHELRLEFVLPEEGGTSSTFTPIRLIDGSRWWNQPDQLESLYPDEAFWFNIKIEELIEIDEPESEIKNINGNNIIDLGKIVKSVIITVYDPINDITVQLKENVDFEFMSSKAIKFVGVNNPYEYEQIKIYIVSYNYNAINPAKIIDKSNIQNSESIIDKVLTEVPIWNPAFGEYFYLSDFVVTIKDNIDNANYTNKLDNSFDLSPWLSDKIGEVWFDDSLESYIPYYDKTAIPNFDKRMLLWGKLSEWADIALYEWIQSEQSPEDWDGIGIPYKLLYENIAANPETDDSIWILFNGIDIHEDFIAGLVTPTNTTSLTGDVNIYINGKFNSLLNISIPSDFTNFALTVDSAKHIHLIQSGHIPTQDELDDNLYKYDTPFSMEEKYDVYSGTIKPIYYFWVRGTNNKHKLQNTSVSISEAEKNYKNMNHPYMIIDGLRDDEFGYGLIFGSTFDPFSYQVPNRYTKVIIKGLDGIVKGESRYTLRFTRDFTLRDTLDDALSLKNIHQEWKLFREKQLYKIDKRLWEHIIESIIGKKTINEVVNDEIILPSLERVLYDDLYNKDTKYGLGDEQAFTDKDLALFTINSILNNSNKEFFGIDIDLFRNTFNFDTENNIINTMYEIYNSFSIEDVNYIFFEILRDSFSLKREYKDIFKTSWVALQIDQNIEIAKNIPLDKLRLEIGGDCDLPLSLIPDEETSTPLPSPSPTPTLTVTPSVTPTVTPTISVTPSVTPTVTVTPSVTPTMPMTPTITPTETITPTVTETPTITPTISG